MANHKRRPLAERFEKYVDRSGGPDACHPWTGAHTPRGYGRIGSGGVEGKTLTASRVAWELANGRIPDGLQVCHHCDNPPCCNPAHLFLGTNLDNVTDMLAKGRGALPPRPQRGVAVHRQGCAKGRYCGCRPTGTAHHNARFVEDDIRAIRLAFSQHVSQADLALRYGVSATAIHRIVTGQTWGNVR